jgi:hypothetical protein
MSDAQQRRLTGGLIALLLGGVTLFIGLPNQAAPAVLIGAALIAVAAGLLGRFLVLAKRG